MVEHHERPASTSRLTAVSVEAAKHVADQGIDIAINLDGWTSGSRNEIFARHGFRFRNPTLRAHFSQFSWYKPTSDTVQLSGIEKANVALLKSAEAAAQ